MISKLVFRAGSAATQPPLALDLSEVTLFVGPNNSGKSKALIEIERAVTSNAPTPGLVIRHVELEPRSVEIMEAELSEIQVDPDESERIHADHIVVSRLKPQQNSAVRLQLSRPHLFNEAQSPNRSKRPYYSQFLSLFTLRLDGKSRLAHADPQDAGDLQGTPPNILAKLFADNGLRKRVRDIVFDAFGKYLVVDPTWMGKLRLRLSPTAPVDERQERGWDSDAQEFHSNATLVSEASDGVKAFVGMLTTIVAGNPKIVLIDEPEAFLHPALCARLGKELTSATQASGRRLFVSTHSAAFLMGCVQGGAPINIVRLTYDYSTATARLLAREKLAPLMRNPLLRSIGVLNALFYSAVVVTEADADRAFYQELNERLLSAKDPRGIDGCLFLNAQNKQTVWDIVRPLRELGIPAVGVVDIDVLKDHGSVWAKPLTGAFVPELSHSGLHAERGALEAAFTATGKNMKRDGGVYVLGDPEREACLNLFTRLVEYGVFVVPVGEVEAWLPGLAVSRTKTTWLVSIFEAMGEDPAMPNYVRPDKGDVWDFIGSIKHWVADPARKGIPS